MERRTERLGARVERLARELMREQISEDRTDLNRSIAERMILNQWQDSGGAPGDGYNYFCALLQRALKGPICTPERAKALLPVLLAINDEMDIAEWDERQFKRQQRRQVGRARLKNTGETPALNGPRERRGTPTGDVKAEIKAE